ncbi:hypothetical protein D9M69_510980 [compost metagenome]
MSSTPAAIKVASGRQVLSRVRLIAAVLRAAKYSRTLYVQIPNAATSTSRHPARRICARYSHIGRATKGSRRASAKLQRQKARLKGGIAAWNARAMRALPAHKRLAINRPSQAKNTVRPCCCGMTQLRPSGRRRFCGANCSMLLTVTSRSFQMPSLMP